MMDIVAENRELEKIVVQMNVLKAFSIAQLGEIKTTGGL